MRLKHLFFYFPKFIFSFVGIIIFSSSCMFKMDEVVVKQYDITQNYDLVDKDVKKKNPDEEKPDLPDDRKKIDIVYVKDINYADGSFVIEGVNLNNVEKISIKGPGGFESILSVITNTGANIIAKSLDGAKIVAQGLFQIIISDVYGGEKVFDITFSLSDGSIELKHFSDMGARAGQIIKFDGDKWVLGEIGAMSYSGAWDVSTGIEPTSNPATGDFFIVSNGGVFDAKTWEKGDWAIWNEQEQTWDLIRPNTGYTPLNNAGDTMTGDLYLDNSKVVIDNQSSIQFNDNDVNTLNIISNENMTENYTLVLPPAQGNFGQVLVNDGTGDLTWISPESLINLEDLKNVDKAGLSEGKILKYDGAKWIMVEDLVAVDAVSGDQISTGAVGDDEIALGVIKDKHVASDAAIKKSKIDGLETALDNLVTSTSTNNADIIAINNQLITNTNQIAINKTNTENNKDNIDSNLILINTNKNKIEENEANIIINKNQIDQNISDIAQNKNDISTNKNSISSLGLNKLDKQNGTVIGTLKFKDNDGNDNTIGIKAPDVLNSNLTLTFPSNNGSNGQFLTTNGSGILSWTSGGGGAGGASKLNELSDVDLASVDPLAVDDILVWDGANWVNSDAFGITVARVDAIEAEIPGILNTNLAQSNSITDLIDQTINLEANKVNRVGDTMTGSLTFNFTDPNTGSLYFMERVADPDAINEGVGLRAPNVVDSGADGVGVYFTLPGNYGAAGDYLTTDASGNLSWTTFDYSIISAN